MKISIYLKFIMLCTTLLSLKANAQDTIMKSEYVRKGNLVLYHDSLFSGVAIHKTDSGQIVAIENYKNGLADGRWKEWYKTGELKFEGAYKDGLNDGVWTQWYIDGRVQRKLTFVNGKLIPDK